jgi:hypothetical protein
VNIVNPMDIFVINSRKDIAFAVSIHGDDESFASVRIS